MSRIGRQPIVVPEGISVLIGKTEVTVEGEELLIMSEEDILAVVKK